MQKIDKGNDEIKAMEQLPSSASIPDLPHRASDEHLSSDDSQNGDNVEQGPELEAQLSRVSSGPPYSVFSRKMIWWIIAMNCISAFISPITANIYFPAIPAIADDLGVSTAAINLSLTTYMIFQGLSPTFVGDFGDAAGRRPAFIIAFIIYLGANIGLALQRNYAALLILRCLQSAGSSGTIALVFGVVADISTSAERGKFMGIVGAGLTIGPSIGPTIGGLLTQYLGWPSVFWFCTVVTIVFIVPYVLTVPETGRKVVGNGSIKPQVWNMTLLDYIRFRRLPRDPSVVRPKQKIPIPNPLNTLRVLGHKDMAMVLFYNGMLYIGFMLITSTLSTQFADIYHYNELVLGLCYLPIGFATMAASICQGFILDWNYRRTAKKLGFKIDKKRGDNLKDFPIERVRIQVIAPCIFLGCAVYIGYAWALQARVHVAVPLVLSFFIGLFVTGSFQVINTLIVDLYPEAPATATAANNLVRCLFGAVATAVIEDMIKGMGRGWALTLIALVFTVPSPILWVVQKHGPTWREQRRVQMLKQKEKQEEAKEKESSEAGTGNAAMIEPSPHPSTKE
ncbi:chloramphenicol resistance protein [Truncatella angustata]|uniref:Chloramphenicol resistance protein n=1 Tax=Truncatella angustata TaxID=152316 RepID=A0A9P9A551_9PEZI|nr:chloramphenicol resistance protein [Truncatella angustata]KAH6660950.1 chloramphenicol resistance protein [Truncatella angustata]